MAQLRHDYEEFKALNAEVLVLVPNGPKMIDRFRGNHEIPYPILSDRGSRVGEQYFQVKHFFKLGTPTIFVVDQAGRIRYAHYAASLLAEPDNEAPLAVLAQLKG